MQTLSQADFIKKAEHQLEEQLKEVISVFQNLSEADLLKPASNNGWSIAECIEHLNTYAAFYLPQVTMATEKAPLINSHAVFKHSFLGRYFINSMEPTRNKKKFKALKMHLPLSLENPNKIISTFIQHLENMLALLKQATHKNLRKNSVKTSISPWIKISPGDTIQFLLTHNRRHLAQAKQNLLSTSF
jgi:uncharacterized damage-inducible protein DinB